jgi:hypothetical protein
VEDEEVPEKVPEKGFYRERVGKAKRYDLRLPAAAGEEIARIAARNLRSVNNELVRAVLLHIEREQAS